MPSKSSRFLMKQAQKMAVDLYGITITDSWYPDGGGNIEQASNESQRHSMAAVFSGIRSTGGSLPSEVGGQHITQDRESWLAQGQRTLEAGRGVCTDCAAAAAVRFLEILDASGFQARVEIISSGTHAFLVVNRQGGINDPRNWGDDAFVIDVWYQNQFPRDRYAGAFWMTDPHPVSQFILENAHRLRIDLSLQDAAMSAPAPAPASRRAGCCTIL